MLKNIIIIGAGPIGCYTAQVLKTYGYNPLVIEEHNEVGKPIHCTGLVGNKVFGKNWPFNISPFSTINCINGAVIHYDNQHFFIERNKVAYVIDRERFDKELSKGLNILYQNKFIGLEKADSGYIIETDKDELFADIVIGADGANSVIRRTLNPNTDFEYYRGVQLRIKTVVSHPDIVNVYLKKPSFFWVVPESKDTVRVGTISENPYRDLQKFLKEEKIKGEVLERFGGAVALGICNNTVRDNIALVGDAACQLKPLTYGGIYFGLKAATILTHCIKGNCIQDYDAFWKRELAPEIKIGLKIRSIYNSLEAKDLKKIFNLLKTHKSLIERAGDFDNHSRLITELIKRPAFYSGVGDILQIFFKKLLL